MPTALHQPFLSVRPLGIVSLAIEICNIVLTLIAEARLLFSSATSAVSGRIAWLKNLP
jgi:hypothetical protein